MTHCRDTPDARRFRAMFLRGLVSSRDDTPPSPPDSRHFVHDPPDAVVCRHSVQSSTLQAADASGCRRLFRRKCCLMQDDAEHFPPRADTRCREPLPLLRSRTPLYALPPPPPSRYRAAEGVHPIHRWQCTAIRDTLPSAMSPFASAERHVLLAPIPRHDERCRPSFRRTAWRCGSTDDMRDARGCCRAAVQRRMPAASRSFAATAFADIFDIACADVEPPTDA